MERLQKWGTWIAAEVAAGAQALSAAMDHTRLFWALVLSLAFAGIAAGGLLLRWRLHKYRILDRSADVETPVNPVVPWGEGDEVPLWAVDAAAARYKQTNVVLWCGPPLHQAWRALRDTGVLFVVSPLLTFCVSEKISRALAQTPPWVPLVLGCGALRLVWHEFVVRKFLLPIITLRLNHDLPTALGMKVSFKMWFLFCNGMSIISHLDVVNVGIFAARVLRTDLSGTDDSFGFSHAWALAMRHSIMPSLEIIPFCAFAILGWVLVAFQGVYAVTYCWPSSNKDLFGEEIHYEFVESGQNPMYQTGAYNKCNHGDALVVMMQVCRMNTLLDTYEKLEDLDYMEGPDQKMQLPGGYGAELHRAIAKLTLFSLLGSAYQANLQVSGLGLARATNKDNALDSLTLASIFITILLGLYTITKQILRARELKRVISSIEIREELRKALERVFGVGLSVDQKQVFLNAIMAGPWSDDSVWSQAEPMARQALPHVEWDRGAPLYDFCLRWSVIASNGLQAQRSVHYTYGKFLFVVALCSLLLARATFKATMVVICPTGLHNFGTGCVNTVVE